MKFEMKVTMNNQAFIDDPNELPRILAKLAKFIEEESITRTSLIGGHLMDINGNSVGNYMIEPSKAKGGDNE